MKIDTKGLKYVKLLFAYFWFTFFSISCYMDSFLKSVLWSFNGENLSRLRSIITALIFYGSQETVVKIFIFFVK